MAVAKSDGARMGAALDCSRWAVGWGWGGEPGLVEIDASPYDSTKGKEFNMTESTITAKGQTTVPRQVRDQIGAGPGTRLVWHVMPNGTLLVRAKTKSLLDLAGTLSSPDGKVVPVDDMSGWR
jgi:bifunctional DNA-binding transcriptional regulator/antitoxin component of YhaV-PrlF toxin-antitoxin module